MLPSHIQAIAEFSPVEDLCLAILRDGLPGVEVSTLIRHDQSFPFVLVGRADSFGQFRGDHRFLDSAQVVAHAMCEDPDGDEDSGLLAEAIRVVIRDAWLDQKVVPGRGHITGFNVVSPPHRVTDWATSTGPVQYADLPTGVHRYEVRFELSVKKPKTLII